MRVRETLVILFGIIQSVLAFSAMTLACVLYFNFFGVQSVWNIPQDARNVHVAILLTLGVFLIASGLFLIIEWRESH
jgi:formate hydrogenlyase subunit 3/multisubunit Na+/H+ antiporter MnhD subunit